METLHGWGAFLTDNMAQSLTHMCKNNKFAKHPQIYYFAQNFGFGQYQSICVHHGPDQLESFSESSTSASPLETGMVWSCNALRKCVCYVHRIRIERTGTYPQAKSTSLAIEARGIFPKIQSHALSKSRVEPDQKVPYFVEHSWAIGSRSQVYQNVPVSQSQSLALCHQEFSSEYLHHRIASFFWFVWPALACGTMQWTRSTAVQSFNDIAGQWLIFSICFEKGYCKYQLSKEKQ